MITSTRIPKTSRNNSLNISVECPTCISATVFKSKYDYQLRFCHDAKEGEEGKGVQELTS